jgi:hypothetical protein
MAELVTIKKIKTAAGEHDIDAKYLGGHTFTEIESMVHGGVETYVIPTSNSSVSGYSTIVNATGTTVSTTKTVLNNLTGGQANGGYKLGDVVLMEGTSDGTKVFDRWISKVDGENITLAVLETQVATHHHKLSTNTSNAYTGVSSSSTVTLTSVGAAVTVLTDATGTFVTSVGYTDDGKNTLALTSDSDGLGHSHSISEHTHSTSFKPNTLVSRIAKPYTSVSTSSYTPHTHTVLSVAGVASASTNITYATGVEKVTGTYVVNMSDSSQTTGGTELTTKDNTSALSTSTMVSTDTVGEVVKTTSSGAHTHNVTTTTDTNVVTGVSLAATVVTSVKITHTKPTVADTAVTSWSCEVDDSGVLSFTVASTTQSAGTAATISAPSSAQTYTSGTVNATGTAKSAGAHTHGFSHTHAIPSHTHGVNSHSHTYVKTVVSQTGTPSVTLTTKTHTPHTHSTVNVVGTTTNDSPITYVYGGLTTDVVRDLLSTNQTFTTTSKSLTTDTKYVKLTGDIIFPGLNAPTGSVTVTSKSITPAVTGTEKALKDITFNSSSFVTSVTGDGNIKTSPNVGGE